MDSIKISIVIPTYNRKDLLKEMLLSLCNQTSYLEQTEVIVVMDGSTDGTEEMLKTLDAPFKLRPVSQEQSGPAAARNHGARLASGKVILFMDDDLIPKPGLLKEHMAIHEQEPRAVVLGRFIPLSGVKGKGGWNIWEERVLERHFEAMKAGRRPASGRRLYSGNFSVGKEYFLDVGGFDEGLKRGEDIELGFRLQRSGLKFYYNHQAVAIHRGYRSYESWLNSAYLYGQSDVRLAKEKNYNVLPEVFGWYHNQPSIVRVVLRATLDRNKTRKLLLYGFHRASGALTDLRVYRLAHIGYSGIYKLQYWQGVSDEIGSRQAFFGQAHRLDAGREADSIQAKS